MRASLFLKVKIYLFVLLFVLLACISCAPFAGTTQPTPTRVITQAPIIPYVPPVPNVLTITAADNTLFALQALNGTQRWYYTADSYLGQPVVSNAIAYVASINGTVYAVRANDGSLLWRHSFAVKGFSQAVTVNTNIIYFSISTVTHQELRVRAHCMPCGQVMALSSGAIRPVSSLPMPQQLIRVLSISVRWTLCMR